LEAPNPTNHAAPAPPQIDEGRAPLTARLLDLRPEEALPRVRAALDAGGGGGGGGGGA
jgi:hypothetical protein